MKELKEHFETLKTAVKENTADISTNKKDTATLKENAAKLATKEDVAALKDPIAILEGRHKTIGRNMVETMDPTERQKSRERDKAKRGEENTEQEDAKCGEEYTE